MTEPRERRLSLWTREFRLSWPTIRRWETILIVFGIVARLAPYVWDRPMWLDEGSLAGNITKTAVFDFSKPLFNDQLAPVGFLIVERLIFRVLGGSSRALRLIPLCAGIGALFLMRAVARRMLKPRAAVLALAMFSLCDDLIYYATEIKQYSSDVLLALLCLWYVLRLKTTAKRSYATFACFGCVAVWFSFPAVFVLAGVGSTLIVQSLLKRERFNAYAMIAVATAWSASFAASYVFLSKLLVSKYTSLWVFWGFAFPPRPIAVGSTIAWTVRIVLNLFINPLGFNTPLGTWVSVVLPATLFAVGGVALARKDLARLSLVLAPILFAFAAGAARLSPFYGRLILWVAPFVYLIVAAGIELLGEKNRRAFAIAPASLLCFTLIYAVMHIFDPRDRTDPSYRGDLRRETIVSRRTRIDPIEAILTIASISMIGKSETVAPPLESPTDFGQTDCERLTIGRRRTIECLARPE